MIELKNICKTYDGAHTVLDGISMTIDSGEFLMLIGKSGCGKSTLLNILCWTILQAANIPSKVEI